MLMPAAALIMVVLSALAVDRAIVFGAQRDLVAVAQSAANDGASLGVDLDHLRRDGELAVDEAAIDMAIAAAVVAAPPGTTVRWWLQGDDVVVALEHQVSLLFAPGVPGAERSTAVTATASAELRLSDP
jgi:hypothetical protein